MLTEFEILVKLDTPIKMRLNEAHFHAFPV
jgi:hypothetical protein